MNKIQLGIDAISTAPIRIGFEGENVHTQVTFFWTVLRSKYPDAVASLSIKPPVGDIYPKSVTQDGNKVVWDVTASDTANPGSGEYQLTFTDGEEIIKTYIGNFTVNDSIIGDGEAPDPIQDWVADANAVLGELSEISASVMTIEAGESATVEVTEVGGHKNLAFGIPAGEKGEQGEPGDPAPAEEVIPAVNAYLAEVITNPDSPPLDRTLSSSSAAAPADMVGDLKSASNQVINLAGYVGADTPLSVENGETLYIYVLSNTHETNVFVTPYSSGDAILTIPANAYGLFEFTASKSGKLKTNASGTTIDAIVMKKGEYNNIHIRSDETDKGIELYLGDVKREWSKGKYIDLSGVEQSNSAFYASNYIPVIANTELKYYLNFPSTSVAAIAFYDENKSFITAEAGASSFGLEKTTIAPYNARYARLSWSLTRGQAVYPYLKAGFGIINKIAEEFGKYFYGTRITTTGEQRITLKQGETIVIVVNSNTVETNLMCGQYSSGDPYVRMYVGKGIYKLTPNKNGTLRVQTSGTTIDAVVYKANRIDLENRTYRVGGNGADFQTFTQALIALKNDNRDKTIIISAGEYDVFEEMGGAEFAQSIPSTVVPSDWKEYNNIVPPNTTIIGEGNVVLKYMPDDDDVTTYSGMLISPLNVQGNCIIKNIEIHGKNCRYVVHDEMGVDSINTYARHEYYNVRIIRESGVVGNPQTYGAGIGQNGYVFMDTCEIIGAREWVFTSHTNRPTAGNGGSIILNNCVIKKSADLMTVSEVVRFITGDEGGSNPAHNIAKLNNCYIGGKLALAYDGSSSGIAQSFDLTAIGCNANMTVEIYDDFASNPYTPKIYNPVPQ